MTTAEDFKEALRAWVVRVNGKVAPADIGDDTPILERRLVTSLQVLDLVLFIEDLAGDEIDAERLQAGVFQDINTICANFCLVAADAN